MLHVDLVWFSKTHYEVNPFMVSIYLVPKSDQSFRICVKNVYWLDDRIHYCCWSSFTCITIVTFFKHPRFLKYNKFLTLRTFFSKKNNPFVQLNDEKNEKSNFAEKLCKSLDINISWIFFLHWSTSYNRHRSRNLIFYWFLYSHKIHWIYTRINFMCVCRTFPLLVILRQQHQQKIHTIDFHFLWPFHSYIYFANARVNI